MYEKLLLSTAMSLFSLTVLAWENRKSFDINLIEIYDLKDLNAIRDGISEYGEASLYGLSQLCPATNGCVGYELMNELDFDTNGDGNLDAKDTYWNDGQGWLPIKMVNALELKLDGNGHLIRNLIINRPNADAVGLFGQAQNLTIHSLGVTGPQLSVRGGMNTGILAGNLIGGSIERVFTSGRVEGERVGGLFGSVNQVNIRASFSTANVSGLIAQDDKSGVGGFLGTGSCLYIFHSYFAGDLIILSKGTDYGRPGGLAGTLTDGSIQNIYWLPINGYSEKPIDLLNGDLIFVQDSEGVNLADLKCPKQPMTPPMWRVKLFLLDGNSGKTISDSQFGTRAAVVNCRTEYRR